MDEKVVLLYSLLFSPFLFLFFFLNRRTAALDG